MRSGAADQEDVHKAAHTPVMLSLRVGAGRRLVAAPVLAAERAEDVFPFALLYLRIYLAGMSRILPQFISIFPQNAGFSFAGVV